MTDDNIELTRRKILAGAGAIGVAGAGASLGTTAYYSDEESFDGNTIAAGELDLKVDWEEHYSYPQIYGFGDPTENGELDVTRSEPDDADGYVALPDPENPAVWVAEDDLSAYMDNTAIEAYPDVNDDGVQDEFGTGEVGDVCTDGADVAADLDPSGLRTDNADTVLETGEAAPLVNLDDVKPGDFGELTLSYHLCDNPGYVWLNGELVDAAENGVTEPEAASDDEVEGEVELLDEIEVTIWYDGDCDNVFEPGGDEGEEGEPADVVLVIDRSGSMDGQMSEVQSGANDLVDALGPNDQVGLVSFSSSGPFEDDTEASTLDAGLTANHGDVKGAVDDLDAGGNTNMEAAVERAHEELTVDDTFDEYGESGGARPDARKIMIFLGDGSQNEGTDVTDWEFLFDDYDPSAEAANARDDGVEIFTIAYGNPGSDAEDTLQDMASDPTSEHYFEADTSDIEEVLEDLGGTVGTAGEELITRGSLRDVLAELEDGDGIPLDGDLDAEGRQPYPAMQTNCVGFAWHLPTDVGNEVQTDSVEFDVGFYTEQARHNDGSGPSAAD